MYIRGNGWEVVAFSVHLMLVCVKFVRSDRSELCVQFVRSDRSGLCVYSLYVVTGVDYMCTVCT